MEVIVNRGKVLLQEEGRAKTSANRDSKPNKVCLKEVIGRSDVG